MAIRTALRLSNPNLLEHLPLMAGVEIQQLAPPGKFVGKSLQELDLRNKYNVNVIAVKGLIPEKTTLIPDADFVVKDSDILVVIGEKKDLKKISEL